MRKIGNTSIVLMLATTAFIAGCSSSNNEAPSSATPPTETATQAAPAPEVKKNAPLTAEQVKLAIEQIGPVTYAAADDTIDVKFKLTNNGTAAFPASGEFNVIIGIVQLIKGEDGEYKRGESTRVPLPSDLAPGASIEIDAKVPVAFAQDKKIQIEPLQEGVAWFNYDFKQPVVIVGPFARCDDKPGTLCDESGKAIGAL